MAEDDQFLMSKAPKMGINSGNFGRIVKEKCNKNPKNPENGKNGFFAARNAQRNFCSQFLGKSGLKCNKNRKIGGNFPKYYLEIFEIF